MRRAVFAALFCILLAFATPHLHAQSAPSPDAAPQGMPGDPNGNDDSQSVATFHQNVNLVSLYFDVRDKKNMLIPHLTQDDCRVFEDKVPQTLKNFVAEVDQPLTLGILLDTSASQRNVLPLEQQTGSEFLRRILRSKDQAFLVSFDVDIDLLSDFSSNPAALARDMDKAQINVGTGGITTGPLPTGGAPKGTLLYDAVVEAANDKLAGETGRKAMILLTDGEDQGSTNKLRDAIEAAQKANTMVYVLLIADRGFYGGGMYSIGYTGDGAMRQLADQTGGRVINVGNNGKKLEAAFQQIEDELRTQYVASYTPTNAKTDGTYRHVEIECHQQDEALKVQSRKGYYAIAAEN